MTEQKNLEQKPGIFKQIEYVSSEFDKDGETKEGKPWKLYRVKFKVDEYENTFSAFSPLPKGKKGGGLQLADLEKGKKYSVGYNEEEILQKSGEVYTAKTIFYIGPSREQKATEEKKEADDTYNVVDIKKTEKDTTPIMGTMAEEMEEFVTIYTDNVAPDKRHISHFVGAFLRKYKKDNLVDKLEAVYKQKVEAVVEEVV